MGWNQLKFEVGRAELENSLAVGVRGCRVGKLKGTECRRDAWRGTCRCPGPAAAAVGGYGALLGTPPFGDTMGKRCVSWLWLASPCSCDGGAGGGPVLGLPAVGQRGSRQGSVLPGSLLLRAP